MSKMLQTVQFSCNYRVHCFCCRHVLQRCQHWSFHPVCTVCIWSFSNPTTNISGAFLSCPIFKATPCLLHQAILNEVSSPPELSSSGTPRTNVLPSCFPQAWMYMWQSSQCWLLFDYLLSVDLPFEWKAVSFFFYWYSWYWHWKLVMTEVNSQLDTPYACRAIRSASFSAKPASFQQYASQIPVPPIELSPTRLRNVATGGWEMGEGFNWWDGHPFNTTRYCSVQRGKAEMGCRMADLGGPPRPESDSFWEVHYGRPICLRGVYIPTLRVVFNSHNREENVFWRKCPSHEIPFLK